MKSIFNIIGFRKLFIGFLVIIAITLFNLFFTFSIIHQNNLIVTKTTRVINPYIETLDKFNLLVTQSKMLTTNWVYLHFNTKDKKALVNIHNALYPQVKSQLLQYTRLQGSAENADSMSVIFENFEGLLKVEKQVMDLLASFDDYENPMKKFNAEELIEKEVLPRSDKLFTQLDALIDKKREEAESMKELMLGSFFKLILTVSISAIGMFILLLLAGFYISKSIKSPVMKMQDIMVRLSKGELVKEHLPAHDDVIGQMVGAVNTLTASVEKTATFANRIGNGNLKAEYHPLSDKDILGNALINMRDNLRIYSENLEQLVEQRTQELKLEKEKVEKQSKVIEKKNKDITASIQYAKRIQEATLPVKDTFHKLLPDSFILFKPRDIVSGDFYWFTEKNNKVVVAAVDCTGHGVPGAFMSLIGNNLLDDIVNKNNELHPSKILNQLNKGIFQVLKKEEQQSDTVDGMDIALCVWDAQSKTLEFAAAGRSLLLVRNGTVQKISGDKLPLGLYFKRTSLQYEYHSHPVTLQKGDTIYIYSDGYCDQFGGESGEKFMHERFENLLKSIQDKAMYEQEKILLTTMETWKGEYAQTDDILIVGIKI